MHECSQVELFHPLVSVLFSLPIPTIVLRRTQQVASLFLKNKIKSCISDCKKKKKTKRAPGADFVGINESGR